MQKFLPALRAKRIANSPDDISSEDRQQNKKKNIGAAAAKRDQDFESGNTQQNGDGDLISASARCSHLGTGQESELFEAAGVVDARLAPDQRTQCRTDRLGGSEGFENSLLNGSFHRINRLGISEFEAVL